MCFWVNQEYMFLSQSNVFINSRRWIFISSPVGFVVSPVGFLISPVENVLLCLTLEKFSKLAFSPMSQADTTGVLRQGVTTLTTLNYLHSNSFLAVNFSALNLATCVKCKCLETIQLTKNTKYYDRLILFWVWNIVVRKFLKMLHELKPVFSSTLLL